MINGSNILVFGRSGQLASSLKEQPLFKNSLFLGSRDFNLLGTDKIMGLVLEKKPDLVLNAAAYTQVDNAEQDIQSALALNELAPAEMAKACKELSIPLVHFSSDYVFDGGKSTPYKESDQTNPLGQYGESKRRGEEAILRYHPKKSYVFRTSWVFGPYGNNFVKTMIRLSKNRDELRIVSDQYGSPTSTTSLSNAISTILTRQGQYKYDPGIYHLTNKGSCSWFEFTEQIFSHLNQLGQKLKTTTLVPIKTSEYPTLAKRPVNSRLDNGKFETQFGFEMPSWKDALKKDLKTILTL